MYIIHIYVYINTLIYIYIYIYMLTCIGKAWAALDRLIWKSDFSNEIKREFFQGFAMSELLYGCTIFYFNFTPEEKLDGN